MTATVIVAEPRERSRWVERAIPWALLLPALALVLSFFALPAVYMLRMSFNLHTAEQIYITAWSLDNYVRLLSDPLYLSALAKTFLLALITATATVAFSYVFSLFIWMRKGPWKLVFLAIALCPLLISEISVIFGWWMFFPNNGLMSVTLLEFGLVEDKVSLMYTMFAAVVGLTYITLPFGVFILLSIFDGLDRRLLEASGDLGASPIRTFREVLLPLTKGGIIVAFSQAFIWSMGTYATPSALGPDWLWTIGFEIYRQMNSWRDWPFASVLAVFLVLAILATMMVTRRMTASRTDFHA